jgi:hypothetical protein
MNPVTNSCAKYKIDRTLGGGSPTASSARETKMSAMSPRYEFISVSLETVAFFLVTIELYGKERLTNATDRLRGFLG